MKMTSEKDQEIQRLHDQINQLLNQQGSQVTEMEEEEVENILKIKPERIEIEENKEGEEKKIPPPTQSTKTRSQGPPSFGEQIQQEVYDPLGNLVSKRTGYVIPGMGEYGTYDVVVNLISYDTGNNAKFKDNFVNYAREVEKDLRSYATKDNMGFITKAVKNELKNDIIA